MAFEKEIERLEKEVNKMLRGRGVMEIDIANLDREWSEQATRHKLFCDIAAIYGRVHDDAKAAMEVAKALAARGIRKKPEKYLIDAKVTEPAVKESLSLHPVYQKAQTELNQAAHSLEMAKGAVSASQHRKTALEKLVDLWSQSYFGRPKEGRKKSKKVLD
jgi:hypothetical protein